MATNFSPCKGSYVLNQSPSNVMFGMNGFHVSASGAIQGHHGPLVVLKTATAPTVGPDDLVLEVWYYDFSRSHTDFQDINYVSVTNPTYVPSPYGAWLAASTTPSTDTFSTWFRYDDVGNNNYEINDTLILVNQADSSKL